MFCENLISRVKPFFIYKNEIYLIENQRFFLQHQQFLRMIAIPTLSISRIIALWCIFWSMTKNQGICQQCHPWFSPPLFSKSLLTEGWCFAGILGRASLTEGPIYCRQTIDTVRLILCFTCRPVHPGLDIWPWPLRSLLVDLEILLGTFKHLKASLWAALDMYDLGSKRFRLKKYSSGTSGFQKTLSGDTIFPRK